MFKLILLIGYAALEVWKGERDADQIMKRLSAKRSKKRSKALNYAEDIFRITDNWATKISEDETKEYRKLRKKFDKND